LPQRFGPWQPVDAEPRDAFREQARRVVVRLDAHRPIDQRDRTQPAQLAPAQARARRVERDLVAGLDAVTELCLDLVERKLRRQQDAPLRRGAGDLGYRKKRLARQRRRWIDVGAASTR